MNVDFSSEPEVELTYFAFSQSGEAGDPYVGLDRFGGSWTSTGGAPVMTAVSIV